MCATWYIHVAHFMCYESISCVMNVFHVLWKYFMCYESISCVMKVFHVLWKVFHVCDEIHSYFWHTFSHATNMNVSRRTHELLSITHEILSSHMKYFHNTWISFITSYACISCVRRDTFIFVAWPIHTCGIRMCTVTHSHVYCESFVRILWLIRTCTVTHSYEYCDSFSTKRKFTRNDALGAWGCWSWVWSKSVLGLKTSHGT